MNLDPPPLNEGPTGKEQFTTGWKRSLNQLYAFVRAGGGGGGSGITSLTGDISATGPGVAVATLPNVNSTVGTFADATITVNAKGQVTSAAAGAGGAGITALTGDVTATGPGSVAATLKTIPGVVGSYQNINATIDINGRVTAASTGNSLAEPQQHTLLGGI